MLNLLPSVDSSLTLVGMVTLPDVKLVPLCRLVGDFLGRHGLEALRFHLLHLGCLSSHNLPADSFSISSNYLSQYHI